MFLVMAKVVAKTKNKFDMIVVGGGLAGLTLAALLGAHKFSVLCIDREDMPKTLKTNFDGRTTAISYGSSLVLQEAGIWEKIEKLSCPINTIKILDGPSPVLMDFLSEDVEGRAFGHIAENRDIRASLYARLKELKTVTHLTGEEVSAIEASEKSATISTKSGHRFSAALVIAADGKNSAIRKFLNVPTHGWDYGQAAIVCCVAHEFPHNNTAIEHFRDEGPFAILPMRDDKKGRHISALVWTLHGKNTAQLIKSDADTFNTALAARFPENYGAVECVTERFSYPLNLQHAHSYIGNRVALIAEAAHAMHPIAGQGLNMGMRDIKALSDLLVEARDTAQDIGSEALLTKFQRSRRFDTSMMMAATDTLNKLFSNNLPLIGPLRRLGVALVDKIPPAKKFFMHQAMGLKTGLRSGLKVGLKVGNGR